MSRIHLAVERSAAIARQADVIAALSLEVLKGSTKAFREGFYSIYFGVKLRINLMKFLFQY